MFTAIILLLLRSRRRRLQAVPVNSHPGSPGEGSASANTTQRPILREAVGRVLRSMSRRDGASILEETGTPV